MSTTESQRGRDLVDEYSEAHGFALDHPLDTIIRLVRDVLLYVEDEYQESDVDYIINSAGEGL